MTNNKKENHKKNYNRHISSNKVKYLRNKNNLKQSELAERTNISLSTVKKIESGGSIPRTDTLIKLCTFFNVSADYLLSLDENSKGTDEIYDISLNPKDYLYVEGLTSKEIDYIKNTIKFIKSIKR